RPGPEHPTPGAAARAVVQLPGRRPALMQRPKPGRSRTLPEEAMTPIWGAAATSAGRRGRAERAGRRQAGNPVEPGHATKETPMQSVTLYCVMQAGAAELQRRAQREAPARAAGGARRTRTPGRGHRARGLPAAAARRLRTVPGGRQPMTGPLTAHTPP